MTRIKRTFVAFPMLVVLLIDELLSLLSGAAWGYT
jgi:hypothetical protein